MVLVGSGTGALAAHPCLTLTSPHDITPPHHPTTSVGLTANKDDAVLRLKPSVQRSLRYPAGCGYP